LLHGSMRSSRQGLAASSVAPLFGFLPPPGSRAHREPGSPGRPLVTLPPRSSRPPEGARAGPAGPPSASSRCPRWRPRLRRRPPARGSWPSGRTSPPTRP
jgi:hypothetical protein